MEANAFTCSDTVPIRQRRQGLSEGGRLAPGGLSEALPGARGFARRLFSCGVWYSFLLLVSMARADVATQAEIFQRRVLLHPRDWLAWEKLVRSRLEMEDLERAEKALGEWRLRASGLEQVGFRIDLVAGLLAEKQKRPEEAVLLLRRAVSDGTPSSEVLRAIARIRSSQQQWQEAIASLSEVISNPNVQRNAAGHARLLAMRAEWKTRLRDWSGALEDIEGANQLHAEGELVQKLYPSLESLRNVLSQLSDLDRAVAEAQTGEEKAEELLKRSRFFVQKKWNTQAYEDARIAHTTAPDFIYTQFWRGFCAHVAGHSGEAAPVLMPNSDYREWILDPRQIRILESIDGMENAELQAEALLNLEQPLMALALVESIDGSPVKVEVFRMLADPVRARRAAVRAFELHPDSPVVRLLWAESEFENGNLTEAQAHVRWVRKLNDGSLSEKAAVLEKKIHAGRGGR